MVGRIVEQLVGQSLDRYQIVSLLSEGRIGAVFKAHDDKLQRDVAIQVMHPQFAQRPDFQERFSQAARTAAQMRHPGLVKVFDFGEARSLLYVVMEYILGDTLRTILHNLRATKKWIALAEAVQLVRQVCLAVDYAHQQGVLHRDVKPDNILIKFEPSEGDALPYQPVLTDLGLAELLADGATLQESAAPGTLAYLSPEQASGDKTDARSDVYALGVLLYELAVARLPFRIESIAEAIRYHTQEAPPAPRSIRPDLPEPVERVILKALEKEPANRFTSAGAMAEALAETLPAASEADAAPGARAWAVSLMTQYQPRPAEARAPSSPVGPPEAPSPTQVEVDLSRDRIQIVERGRDARWVPMKAQGLTIGRGAGNDVVIDHPKVSRHHARVAFDGRSYRVIDLNSANGAYLDNVKLMPGVPEEWTPDKPLRIGDSWLRLERAAQLPPVPSAAIRTDSGVIDPSLIQVSPGAGRVGVFMEMPQLSVVPGNRATTSVIILNRGLVDDHFKVSVVGVPTDWVSLSLPVPTVQLSPGEQQEVKLTIQPPRSPQSRAGRYRLTIQVASRDAPDELAEVKVTLTVIAYSQFSSDLRPQQIHVGQTAQVVVQNEGNTQETFSVICTDAADELAFEPPEVWLTLPEGQVAAAEFQAVPRRPRLIGNAQAHAFSAQVSSTAGQVQTHSGEVISIGLIPPWIPPLVLVALAGAVILIVAALIFRQPPQVVASPSISNSFSNPVGMKSTLTFTITNPNTATVLTGVAFSDTFPISPGAMLVASPLNFNTADCGSPTFSPTVDSPSISFSNGTIAGGGTCIVMVDVTAPTGGMYTNTSSAVTSANGGTGNPATATLTVGAITPTPTSTLTSTSTPTTTPTSTSTLTPTNTLTPTQAAVPATTTTLSSNINPSTFGQSVTFTATVIRTGEGANPNCGTIAFRDGGVTLATVNLTANAATTVASTLSAGIHIITADYTPATTGCNFNGSTSNLVPQVINKANTGLSLVSDDSSSTYGQPVTFVATVSIAPPGTAIVTGTVTFIEGGACASPTTTLAGATTLNNNGQATFSTPALSVAGSPHTITACYSGSGHFNPSSANVTQTVTRTVLTIKANNKMRPYGEANPNLDASYSGFLLNEGPNNLSPSSPNCTTTATQSSPPNTYPINCSGQTSPNYAITYNPGTLTVIKASQTITFNPNPLPNKTLGDLPFTVSATASSDLLVSFSASGVCGVDGATVTLTGVGDCTITASQAGNDNYLAALNVMRPFKVNYPTPTLEMMSPISVTEDGPAFPLTVTGTNFLLNVSTVYWGGSPRPTMFSSGTLLTATILTTDITTAGMVTVTVFNSGSGGSSQPLTFTIVTTPTTSLAAGRTFLMGQAASANAAATGNDHLTISTLPRAARRGMGRTPGFAEQCERRDGDGKCTSTDCNWSVIWAHASCPDS